jgi:xanthine/CO dehydrogenase XdhC/CoxF family maturation factor
VGLGCHGIVRVLLEKIVPPIGWARVLAANFAHRRSTALTVIHGGVDPAHWGTRLAAPGDCADPEALFVDDVEPPPALLIFGAGDDAQPLARLAAELGWETIVADPRAAFACAARFPTARQCVSTPADRLVAAVNPGPDALAVIMTHHFVHDVPILRDLLGRPLRYLGLLGPRKRAEKILSDLAATGMVVTAEQRARLHAPVGLDLGADSPEQVALSILAEMQAVRTRRDGRPLRERSRPIHG